MKQKAPKSTSVGERAETAAARFLEQKGFTLIERNYRFRGGEVDLILSNRNRLLLFVEVRQRSNPHFGTGAESVTIGKQRRLAGTANHYLQRHTEFDGFSLRFDVISVSVINGAYQFEWFQEAFWPGDN